MTGDAAPEGEPVHVFISYARRDRAITRDLAERLATSGYRVWYDAELKGGQVWWDVILQAIRDANALLVVLTPDSLRSKACALEWRYASDLGIGVIPLLAKGDIDLRMLPDLLQHLHVVDCTQPNDRAEHDLLRALTDLRPHQHAASPLPTQPPAPISSLGSLADRIAMPTLDRDTQTALVQQLRTLLDDPDTRGPALDLLARMRHRQDLEDGVRGTVSALLGSTWIEPISPRFNFDDIGGLDHLKAYFHTQFEVRRRGVTTGPSTFLLAGPAGVGKSMLAEALAQETGSSMVRLRVTEMRWSEAIDESVGAAVEELKARSARQPVVVVADRLDQMPGIGPSLSADERSVGREVAARLFEAIGQLANGGHLIWVATTDRLDQVDASIVRRFDRVIPVIPPDVAEACRIFAAMPRILAKKSGGSLRVIYGGNLGRRWANEPKEVDIFHMLAQMCVERHMTGADIEMIVLLADEFAARNRFERLSLRAGTASFAEESRRVIDEDDLREAVRAHRPRTDPDQSDLQTRLALRATTDLSLLPPGPHGWWTSLGGQSDA